MGILCDLSGIGMLWEDSKLIAMRTLEEPEVWLFWGSRLAIVDEMIDTRLILNTIWVIQIQGYRYGRI